MRAYLPTLVLVLFTSSLTPPSHVAGAYASRILRRTTRCYDLCAILQAEKNRNPSATKADLAALGNRLIRSRGLPFDFDIGRLLSPHGEGIVGSPDVASRLLTVNAQDGRCVRLRIVGMMTEGLCGESFVSLPVARVGQSTATIHTDRGLQGLQLSSGLEFEQMELVDDSLANVLHRWPVPEQTVPRGVSADGRELYVDYCDELGLALGISERGFRLIPTSPEISPEVEWIEDGPQDPQNAYLSFVRVRQGKTSFYIRFSAPCT